MYYYHYHYMEYLSNQYIYIYTYVDHSAPLVSISLEPAFGWPKTHGALWPQKAWDERLRIGPCGLSID